MEGNYIHVRPVAEEKLVDIGGYMVEVVINVPE